MLSRRRFLIVVAGSAAAASMPELLTACSGGDPGSGTSTTSAGDAPTTLQATILRQGSGAYRRLGWGPGEGFTVRDDLGVTAGAERARNRRSILYFAQLSDTHIIDDQSPGRIEYTFAQLQETGSTRAQDVLTVHVLDQMVRAVNAVPKSPVTEAPLAVAVVTGDNSDSRAHSELRWFIDTLDGKNVTPDSGSAGDYQGVHAWAEATYAYHPDDPSGDLWGEHGYPEYRGMLAAAVKEVTCAGLDVPWLAVFGNHDITWIGTFGTGSATLDEFVTGSHKIATPSAFSGTLLAAQLPGDANLQRAFTEAFASIGSQPGLREVTPDDSRRLFTPEEFVESFFDSPERPGPVGHGFSDGNRRDKTTWWTRQQTEVVRFMGLDTCNHYVGAGGCLPEDQYQWLEEELKKNSSRYYEPDGTPREQPVDDQLFVIFSHHTSWSMNNLAADPDQAAAELHRGEDVVELLLRFPNVIAWVNGHTHTNTIIPHKSSVGGGGGFWEINTASCIDWGQQSRLLDIVDNRDGTISIFTVTLDHAANPSSEGSDYTQERLASISRELSANPWFDDPQAKLGKPEDRNTELLLEAPFDLSGVSDADLEEHALRAELRQVANRLFAPSAL